MKNQNETISLFADPREKGHREWKSFALTQHDRQPGSYRVSLPRIVHVRVRPGAPHHQQPFILRNAH
jgi:hypothetical protein